MNVTIDSYTHRPLEVVATAARTCYSSDTPEEIELTPEQQVKLVRQAIKSGHLSVLEHANFTFHISGVSRALSHQLVRHRIASFSQQSQRYVNMDCFSFVTPPSCTNNVNDIDAVYKKAMGDAMDAYHELLMRGVPAEDARYVIPNACSTNLVMTMNARELLHFFELRCCNRAQWEIRELAWKMLSECKQICPELFENAGPKCWTSKCTEAKPCGNPPKKQ